MAMVSSTTAYENSYMCSYPWVAVLIVLFSCMLHEFQATPKRTPSANKALINSTPKLQIEPRTEEEKKSKTPIHKQTLPVSTSASAGNFAVENFSNKEK